MTVDELEARVTVLEAEVVGLVAVLQEAAALVDSLTVSQCETNRLLAEVTTHQRNIIARLVDATASGAWQ